MNFTSKEFVRSGYALALGNLPHYLLAVNGNFQRVLNAVIVASKWLSGSIIFKENPISPETKPDASTSKTSGLAADTDAGWVEARRDGLKAVINMLNLVKCKDDLSTFGLNDEACLNQIFDCFFYGLRDYSINSKGDSGSRVREVSDKPSLFYKQKV